MVAEDQLHLQNPTTGNRPRRPRIRRMGETAAEAARPRHQPAALSDLEAAAKDRIPAQLSLFTPASSGTLHPLPHQLRPLAPDTPLPIARGWYRQELEQGGRPANTVDSYCYDLVKLEEMVGSRPISEINRTDIADFLGFASNRSTRKRRLTSVRRFFRYLIDDARVLKLDPTEGFFPHLVELRVPVPLFATEQAAILQAAADDEPWSLAAVWLMLRLGLSRSELLVLRREHVDISDPDLPVVYIVPDDASKRARERRLAADRDFQVLYVQFLDAVKPVDLLFPVGFQAVNGMVERVRKGSGVEKQVTPQVLRNTFAVDRARAGADETALFALLGLADDPRNRISVQRYIKLAEPPL